METMLNEKPYGFVPISDTVERTRIVPHNRLDGQRYSGRLDLSITLMASLHIKQGDFGLQAAAIGNRRQESLFYATASRNGIPIIPGSSIKGVIRSIAEAASHSCAPKLPSKIKALEKALPPNNRAQCDGRDDLLCITCSMFGFVNGGKHYKGRVWFSEFKLEGDPVAQLEVISIPVFSAPFSNYPKQHPENIFTPNDIIGGNYGNERLYYCNICPQDERRCLNCHKDDYLRLAQQHKARTYKLRGRKFYMHGKRVQQSNRTMRHQVLKAGSVLKGYVAFENLSREELSLLAFALGLDGTFYPGIGYGKPAYLGKVRIDVTGAASMLQRYGVVGSALTVDEVKRMAAEYGNRQDLVPQINALRYILGVKQGPAWRQQNGFYVY